jgi:methyl-accepting chemotaxis protein
MTLKTILTATASVILALSIVLMFTIYDLIERRDSDIKKYHNDELIRIKESLKDHVDLAYATIDINYKNARDKAYLEKYYGRRLTNIIDIAESIINSKVEAVKRQELTLSDAQAQAAEEIKKLRYDKGKGSIWITDTTSPFPKMVMHPIDPSLDGQEMKDHKYDTALGKGQNLFVAALENSQAHGKGFIDYLWPKTTEGVTHKALKLAYVRLSQEWNWIIGTDIYVDDAGYDAIEKARDELKEMKSNKMKSNNGFGYFWINSTSDTNKIMDPSILPSTEDQILDNDKLKNLFNLFIDICKKQNGSGFYKYKWPKNTMKGDSDQEVNKLSYFKLHVPSGWIVGTSVYIDHLDKTVSEKKASTEEQIASLITKMVIIATIAIFLIGFIDYLFGKLFPKKNTANPHLAGSSSVKQAPVSTSHNFVNPEIPVFTHGANQQTTLRTDECIRMVQEITKTLTAEQSKLLDRALQGISPTNNANQPAFDNAPEMTNQIKLVTDEVKQLANQTYQTINDVKKMVDINQVPSQTTNSADIPQFNQVMGNLDKMVDKGMKMSF